MELQVSDSLLAMRADLLLPQRPSMHAAHVQLQVVGAVGGVSTRSTEFVLAFTVMDCFHV